MLFNTIEYSIFLPIIFLLYWFVTNKSLKIQNLLLLASSYYFYSCWDYRFLFLLIFSTVLDFYTGLKMSDAKNKSSRKFWFWLSITINLGFLGIFKYYNFFANSFAEAASHFGFHANPWTLKVILPVGISFYTFHGLSYVIDIFKERIKAERNFVEYSVFVSFFPLLVAGPIERATHLLPQIKRVRTFEYTKTINGLRQILWGLFKKVVIADNCAEFANTIFNNSSHYTGSMLVFGAIMFTFQIYCDFSGYSDIALGTARLFGIELLRNFAYPYFSRDIAEFWRRWHISLSSWFKDYLYIPLGGSKGSILIKIRNTFIIFIVSGFWHGANWTFIIWGFLNALFIIPSIIFKTNRNNLEIVAKGKYLPTLKELISISVTFSLTVIAWIFFRAENLTHAINYIGGIFNQLFLKKSLVETYNFIMWQPYCMILCCLIMFFVFVEWLGRESQFAIANLAINWNKSIRWGFYSLLLFFILYFAASKEQAFIYFQF